MMKEKEQDPYKDIKLDQKERFIEFAAVGFATAMILYFFFKTLFF